MCARVIFLWDNKKSFLISMKLNGINNTELIEQGGKF